MLFYSFSTGDMLNDSFESNQVDVQQAQHRRVLSNDDALEEKKEETERKEKEEKKRNENRMYSLPSVVLYRRVKCRHDYWTILMLRLLFLLFSSASSSLVIEQFRLNDIMSLPFVSYKWSRQAERFLLKWPLSIACLADQSLFLSFYSYSNDNNFASFLDISCGIPLWYAIEQLLFFPAEHSLQTIYYYSGTFACSIELFNVNRNGIVKDNHFRSLFSLYRPIVLRTSRFSWAVYSGEMMCERNENFLLVVSQCSRIADIVQCLIHMCVCVCVSARCDSCLKYK